MNVMDPSTDRQTSPQVPRDTASELKRELKEFAKLIAWFLVLFLIIKTYVMEAYEVQGPSMYPTLETNDRILVLKLPHVLSRWTLFSALDPVKPGDIIVFDSPDEEGKRYVKRVLAEGPPRSTRWNLAGAAQNGDGDTAPRVSVRIEEGKIYINNQRVEPEYFHSEQCNSADYAPEVDLGPGEYYVVGDNFHHSKDSRTFRAVTDDHVVGKAVLRFWPIRKFGFVR